MLIRQSDGLIRFSIFERFANLICRQTTKIWDSQNSIDDNQYQLKKILKFLKLESNSVYQMEQVHGINIAEIPDGPSRVPQADGLITKNPNTFLLVQVADCLPLYFYHPKTQLVSVVHAGWQGVSGGIIPAILEKWVAVGGKINQTFVAIGPHIGGCCYTIDEERVRIFQKLGFAAALYEEENRWHLDLGQIVRKQLLDSQIPAENIDAPVSCTACQNDIYHSFRKDGNQVGRIIGIIGVNA